VKKVVVNNLATGGKLRNTSITEYNQLKKSAGSCTAKHVSTSSIDMKGAGNSLLYYHPAPASKYPMPKKLSISITGQQ
jgi:hypothetical protein